MVDKKTLAMLVLLIIAGAGWLKAALTPLLERAPYENTYTWTEYFGGYEAYLDRRISCSTLHGSSMEPTIGDGDTVLWVEIDNKAELKVGDIIVYRHPTYTGHPIIAHRIKEIEIWDGKRGFRTQGDNALWPDLHLVAEEDILGLVIGVVYSRNG